MKNLFTLSLLLLSFSASIFCQAPQSFKYQAVVRDNAGEILQNQEVGIRISIHDETATGIIVYQETFSETTNDFGLVNIRIGNGTPTIGNFSGIAWGSNSKFMETEIDPTGGTEYISMGTSELLSVPYALYSATSGGTSAWEQNGDTLYYVTGNVGIGTSSPQGEFHVNNPAEWAGVTFNGTGLNDLNVDYAGYYGTGETIYIAEVTNPGPNPNIFRWSNDNGANWTEDVQMALSGIDVGYGVSIGFDALHGHTYGDQWLWTVSESYMNGLIVKNGKVGIGTDNPTTVLDVNGDINISSNDVYKIDDQTVLSNRGSQNIFLGNDIAPNNTGNSNAYVGYQSGYNNTSGYVNSFLGFQSGYNNTSGAGNTFIGNTSGLNNTTGGQNTFIGDRSGKENTEGTHNTYLGYKSGHNNSTGSDNVCLGYKAGYYETGSNKLYINNNHSSSPLIYGEFDNSLLVFNGDVGIGTNNPGASLDVAGHIWQTGTGKSVFVGESAGENDDLSDNRNVFIGYYAGIDNTTGEKNTASGYASLRFNTTGYENTASGYASLYRNTEGYYNTASGYASLYNNTEGRYNTANGHSSLHSNTEGYVNTASGNKSLYSNTTGCENTASGYKSLYSNTTGYQNTASGNSALNSNTTGYGNTAIGSNALAGNSTGTYNTAIGNSASTWTGTQDNSTALGCVAQPQASNKVMLGNTSVTWIGGHSSWYNTSDARIKNNIQEDVKGLGFIMELRPVT
ncbi:MAG: hypothetical protein K8R58_04560, partial [Bacteroidales bacterium]|nr:hypothetical protein [Bacteroidales bacterium]